MEAIINLSQNVCYDKHLKFELDYNSYGKHSVCLDILKKHYHCNNIDIGYGISELISRIMFFFKQNNLKLTICKNAWPGFAEMQKSMDVLSGNDVYYLVNPSGINGEQLTKSQVTDLAKQYKYIVVDEAYGDFFENSVIDCRTNNMIILKTLSKSIASPGVRFGWCIAPTEVIDTISTIRPRSCTVGGIQDQLEAMLAEIPNHVKRMIETRNFLESNYNCTKSYGNYVLFNTPNKYTEKFICKQIGNHYRMALVDMDTLNE